MPRAAIISDIHANLEALEKVLEDTDRRGIEDIFCLGDIVGYGPDPGPCVDLVEKRCRVAICGNHDEAVLKGPWGFNQLARTALEWTRKKLRPRWYKPQARARWNFLSSLPLQHEWEGFLLVHGSPREPTSEYVLPQNVDWPPPGMFEEIFSRFSTVCFVGHTHLPGVFHEGPPLRFVRQSEIEGSFRHEDHKLLVNVGSVGQPRDRDPRACYVTVEDGEIRFHRVEYPWEVTQRKIYRIGDLDDRLGDRLGEGE